MSCIVNLWYLLVAFLTNTALQKHAVCLVGPFMSMWPKLIRILILTVTIFLPALKPVYFPKPCTGTAWTPGTQAAWLPAKSSLNSWLFQSHTDQHVQKGQGNWRSGEGGDVCWWCKPVSSQWCCNFITAPDSKIHQQVCGILENLQCIPGR